MPNAERGDRFRFEPGSYFCAPNALLEDSRTDSYHIAVYAVIAAHANKRGEAWPSTPTIAKIANCSVMKVKTVLKDLVRFGYFEKAGNGPATHGRPPRKYRLVAEFGTQHVRNGEETDAEQESFRTPDVRNQQDFRTPDSTESETLVHLTTDFSTRGVPEPSVEPSEEKNHQQTSTTHRDAAPASPPKRSAAAVAAKLMDEELENRRTESQRKKLEKAVAQRLQEGLDAETVRRTILGLRRKDANARGSGNKQQCFAFATYADPDGEWAKAFTAEYDRQRTLYESDRAAEEQRRRDTRKVFENDFQRFRRLKPQDYDVGSANGLAGCTMSMYLPEEALTGDEIREVVRVVANAISSGKARLDTVYQLEMWLQKLRGDYGQARISKSVAVSG